MAAVEGDKDCFQRAGGYRNKNCIKRGGVAFAEADVWLDYLSIYLWRVLVVKRFGGKVRELGATYFSQHLASRTESDIQQRP